MGAHLLGNIRSASMWQISHTGSELRRRQGTGRKKLPYSTQLWAPSHIQHHECGAPWAFCRPIYLSSTQDIRSLIVVCVRKDAPSLLSSSSAQYCQTHAWDQWGQALRVGTGNKEGPLSFRHPFCCSYPPTTGSESSLENKILREHCRGKAEVQFDG